MTVRVPAVDIIDSLVTRTDQGKIRDWRRRSRDSYDYTYTHLYYYTSEMQGIIVGRAWAHDVISMHLSTSDMERHAYFWAVINMCDEME